MEEEEAQPTPEAFEGASATGGQTRSGNPKHASHGSIHSFFESRSTGALHLLMQEAAQ